MRNVLSPAPSTSSPLTSSQSALPLVSPLETAARGYAADNLPPKVDPLLDLFTNLLMKHGRKAEAQNRVSSILSLL
jgi:small subunit ribosomal protein S7